MKIVLLALGAAMAVSSAASGQAADRVAEVRHRNNCRLAAQVLTQGQPANRSAWARDYIASCPTEAPEALAEQWTAAAEGADLNWLIQTSVRVPDERVFEAAARVAESGSHPNSVRVAALVAIARLAKPAANLNTMEVVPPDTITLICPLLGGRNHVPQFEVSIPVSASGPTEIIRRVAADRSQPREVWYAAAVLARSIEDMPCVPA
jgi:hypothetical protein